ncbi:hypothetical protein F2Q69_00036786 [Brassica cretica]|uniref:DUF287 domain-containing protein n=1 Tax=Brassica cretica TaxID=69181 RepID=A0A8S9SQ51_BRACR|nr:hypothetical protein F2Q69_00036786 [Brassica cretica]
MAGRGRRKKKSQQRKSTKRNNAPVEEQHVEELSTGNDNDDLSARGNESDHQSASSQVTDSVLVPTFDEEPLMARIMDGEPDYENEEAEFPRKKDKRKVHEEASSSNTSLEDVLKGFEERLMTCLSEVNGKVEKMNKRLGKIERQEGGEPDYENEEGVSNLWSTWLTVKEKPIFWQELYELDVAAREFPQKKDKRKVHEEASSSNTSLEDVLKGFEERLMTCLSEVNGKVEKMNKRLGKIESCQVVLKKRCKRMKAMEKKLEKIEDCQYYLKKKAKKVETLDGRIDGIEKEMKEMKENEKDNESNEDFDYQGMDYDWGGQRNDSNGRVKKRLRRTIKGSEEETEPEPEAEAEEDKEKEDEEESEEEAQKDDRGSEEEKELDPEAEAEENKEKEVETEARVEVQDEVEMNETNEKIPEKEPDEVQDEVEMNEASEIEEEVETEAQVEVETEKTPTPPHGRTKAAAARRQVLTTPEKLFEKAEKMVEEEVEEHEEEAEKMVEEEVEEPEKEAGKMVEEEVEEPEEEAEEMVEDEEADKGAAKPSGTEVKHRPKQMALRKQTPKQAPKKAPKPRGRPRKATQPKKFTTPEQTKRIRSRSQWASTPFTEANIDEIEGCKKKPRTKT